MMPWRRALPLTSAVIAVFNGLRGEAREKAIAAGHYESLMKREPGEDYAELDESLGSQA